MSAKQKQISAADVSKMVNGGRVEEIWRVLDAAILGKAGKAIAGIDKLLASGEHPVGMLAAIGKGLQRLHHAGQLRLKRKSLEDACRDAGIPPFAFSKTRDQHAHLGPARVDRLPSMLLQADLDLKGSSQLPPHLIVERSCSNWRCRDAIKAKVERRRLMLPLLSIIIIGKEDQVRRRTAVRGAFPLAGARQCGATLTRSSKAGLTNPIPYHRRAGNSRARRPQSSSNPHRTRSLAT